MTNTYLHAHPLPPGVSSPALASLGPDLVKAGDDEGSSGENKITFTVKLQTKSGENLSTCRVSFSWLLVISFVICF